MKPDTTQTAPSVGNILAFPPAGARRARRETAGEARGEILLFLGVRYERLPEPEAVPAPRRRRS
ncbi:hypothetical protein [Methylobacterium oxalidis]|uniref:Uncharacterized protein n=1 Tax=Methylobacterium oxalidis TaxID=944322 RepID=A0A512IYJ2_9HYPH|nr:hypothetical protein [Methylobacterium oxalidis]GEP02788.1 hypothetical protein MOX02_08260 [Methylobacterium oxalidis]GJE33775.1 hypothetical protein LDDCCGHA_3978 [Methylobacterium oxalidis]GLS66812.1 hypothetical protein GCM10007888_51950 [Methylobacterium oxalidis]